LARGKRAYGLPSQGTWHPSMSAAEAWILQETAPATGHAHRDPRRARPSASISKDWQKQSSPGERHRSCFEE